MGPPDQNQNDHSSPQQRAKHYLIVAERHLRQGRFGEAAEEAGKALEILPGLQANPTVQPIFGQLNSLAEHAIESWAEGLEFWLEDERLSPDWRLRAEELLARCDEPVDLAGSLSTLAATKALLREVSSEDDKYHEVAAFRCGRKKNVFDAYPITSLAFSPEGLLAVHTADYQVEVWGIDRKAKAWAARVGPGTGQGGSVSFSPDGKLLASAGPFLRLWDANTGKGVRWPDDPQFYQVVAFGNESHLLTAPDANSVFAEKRQPPCLWDTAARRPAFRLPEAGRIRSAGFGPDGGMAQQLALGTWDGQIQVWDLSWDLEGDYPACELRFRGAEHARTIQVGRAEVMSVAFSEGGWLAAADGTSRVQVWALSDGERARSFTVRSSDSREADSQSLEHVRCDAVAFSPTDPRHLAVACSDGAVRVWDMLSGEAVALLRMLGSVTALAFHADGTLAAAGDKGWVHLWRRGLPCEAAPAHRG